MVEEMGMDGEHNGGCGCEEDETKEDETKGDQTKEGQGRKAKEVNIQNMNFSIGVKMYTLMVTSSW